MSQGKPKLLFVDDRSKRIHYALTKYTDYEVTIAPCFLEAMRLLSSQEWDVVSLDHDLEGVDFQDPDTPTCGMAILRYIQKTGWPPHLRKPEFWIHSSNVFASYLMKRTLDDLGFSSRYKKIVYETDNMTYDNEGLPNIKTKFALTEEKWKSARDGLGRCWRCGQYSSLSKDNLCKECFDKEKEI